MKLTNNEFRAGFSSIYRQFIMDQGRFMAVVLNGTTGERCWMQSRPLLPSDTNKSRV